jgi:formiminoglutamase
MKNDQRYLDSLASKHNNIVDSETVFLLSPSDEGVRRNMGRNGARFAPTTILNNFMKLNDHLDGVTEIKSICVSEQELEKENFELSQDLQASLISKELLLKKKNIIHLGGGHDHVFPLLKSIDGLNKYKEILIINIDAHCDTRVDTVHHSGTPFRNFDSITKTKTTLVQYGIHNFANSKTTLSDLQNIEQKIFNMGKKFDFDFSTVKKDTFILLSLDADGLDSSIMKGVSAVNAFGVQTPEMLSIIQKIKETKLDCAFGVYEYNPLYDDLSNQGAKVLSHLIYSWLDL